MRKKVLFVALSIVSVFTLNAQVPDDADPQCREKCSFRGLLNREQQVQFFQYPSMNKYDVKYVKLDITAEANSRFIQGTSLTRAKAVQTLDTFIIELKNNMIVDSVFINGIKKNFTRDNDHVQIPLSPAIPVSTIINALFYYRGTASSKRAVCGHGKQQRPCLYRQSFRKLPGKRMVPGQTIIKG